MKDNYSVKLQCVFCGSENFSLPSKGYRPKEGEQIKCANCGRLNDFDSLHQIAVKQGINEAKKDINNQIKKMFKKVGFKVK